MSSEVVAVLGFALAAVMAAATVMSWRRIKQLDLQLSEGASRYDLGRRHNQNIESELKAANDRVQISKELCAKLEGQLEEAKAKLGTHTRTVEQLKRSHQDEKDRLISKTEDLDQQVKALTQQLLDADALRRTHAQQLSSMEKELNAKKEAKEQIKREEKQLEALNASLAKMEGRALEAERLRRAAREEADKLKELLRKVDPQEIRSLKQRLAKTEQLYTSMKGLREMAEERAENWQVALKALALHVAGTDGKEAEIGPLVARALEKVGATLVDDEHSSSSVSSAQGHHNDVAVNHGSHT